MVRYAPICLAIIVALTTRAASAAATLDLSSPDTRRHVIALESKAPILLDGVLDEEVWKQAVPASDFEQSEPHEGQPASEPTDVRLAFDHEALYLGVYCRDSDPAALIINDIRKDFTPGEQDTFEVLLDTFADRRNGFVFVTNPAGAKSDTQIANEGRDVNTSWDAVWRVGTKRMPDGWSAEIRIPFKTLRFEAGTERLWGINFGRRIRRKNEVDYWAPVPRAYSIYRASLDGDLAGLPDVSQGRNLRVKPFVLGSATRATGRTRVDGDQDVGLDLKYGVTPALTLDVTVNPDFAQAEADQQQVNLTQFSLFFPEKREFFLENSGIFYFGDIPRNTRVTSRFSPPEEELLLFFSRRIGLTASGEQIPILAGGRLTGRAAGIGVGAMSIQTDSTTRSRGNNYTVLRARRDLFRNSDAGAIFLFRQTAGDSRDHNRVLGFDGNFRFMRSLSLNSFVARSDTPGRSGGTLAGKSSVGWEDNFVHLQYAFLTIGDGFNDEVGFVRRIGIRKHFVDSGVRPRPAALRKYGVRELHPHSRINYYTDQSNITVSRSDHHAFTFFMENGGFLEVAFNPRFERIFTPFRIQPDISIPSGGYGWNEYQVQMELDHSRVVSGSAVLTAGGFWSGTQRSVRAALVVRPSYKLLIDVGLQRNDISLRVPRRDFVTDLVSARTNYSFNTNMFLDSLLQWNTDQKQFNANLRFNLIHRPLSDFFVVYNEQQLTDRDVPAGRGVIVKYTHMLAF